MSSEIRTIPADSVRRIVAGQAVADLAGVVKELVENALDAGSTSINVRLFNQGVDIVEVSDDGSGVPAPSRALLATPHATSKLQSFDDLYNNSHSTLGFRGEALFCLANLSSRLVVATRCADEELAQKMEFGRDGALLPAVGAAARKVGTTVAVVRFLDAVPVRRADMKRNIQKQRGKLFRWMEAYAIFSVGVRMSLMDMVGPQCREQIALSTPQGSSSMRETISAVLGSNFAATMEEVSMDLSEVVLGGDGEKRNGASSSFQCSMEGWMIRAGPTSSNTGNTKLHRAVQYYCINGRPVDLPAVTKMLNELWKSFGQASKKPSCILRFNLPPSSYDINLSPDKRQVQLTSETEIVQALREKASQLWASQSNGRFPLNQILSEAASGEIEEAENPEDDEEPGQFNRRYAFSHDFSKVKLQHEYHDGRVKRGRLSPVPQGAEADGNISVGNSKRLRVDVSPGENGQESNLITPSPDRQRNDQHTSTESESSTRKGSVSGGPSLLESRRWQETQAAFRASDIHGMEQDIASVSDHNTSSSAESATAVQSARDNTTKGGAEKKYSLDQFLFRSAREMPKQDDETTGDAPLTSSSLSARRVSDVRGDNSRRHAAESSDVPGRPIGQETTGDREHPDTGGNESPHQAAQVSWSSFHSTNTVIAKSRQHRLSLLERKRKYRSLNVKETPDTVNLTKEDFRDNMEVVGQFNAGFILAKTKDNHLWILDQHACEERYNFEKLTNETVIKEQPLIAPLPLDLSPAEELCVQDNLDIFHKNGFRFLIDESKPPRQRLSLVALPVSGAADGKKAVEFGKDDVSALCSILGVDGLAQEEIDGGTGTDGSGLYGNNAVRRYAGKRAGDNADRILARLPKAVAMFASRACRSSVMIGTLLSESEMQRIIERLSQVESPWHCAHGRTTLNHVGSLGQLMVRDERKATANFAGPTVTVMSQSDSPAHD